MLLVYFEQPCVTELENVYEYKTRSRSRLRQSQNRRQERRKTGNFKTSCEGPIQNIYHDIKVIAFAVIIFTAILRSGGYLA